MAVASRVRCKYRDFTTTEAAEILNVSTITVQRAIDSRALKGYRLPGSLFRRVPRGALLQFMRDREYDQGRLRKFERKHGGRVGGRILFGPYSAPVVGKVIERLSEAELPQEVSIALVEDPVIFGQRSTATDILVVVLDISRAKSTSGYVSEFVNHVAATEILVLTDKAMTIRSGSCTRYKRTVTTEELFQDILARCTC